MHKFDPSVIQQQIEMLVAEREPIDQAIASLQLMPCLMMLQPYVLEVGSHYGLRFKAALINQAAQLPSLPNCARGFTIITELTGMVAGKIVWREFSDESYPTCLCHNATQT